MEYRCIVEARFLSRPNRFIAHVEVNGVKETVHVKNTGRCRELLVPGCTVYLEKSDNPLRKTRYDLVAVKKVRPAGDLIINMDSQAPNEVAEEWLRESGYFGEQALIRREVTYGASRFDFYVESGARKIFMEVKGCTLETDNVASFPDAPTERGVKHIQELKAALKEGYEACLLFIVQMKGMRFIRPNDETHPAFGAALREAAAAGVKVLAVECEVTPGSLKAKGFIPVCLENTD